MLLWASYKRSTTRPNRRLLKIFFMWLIYALLSALTASLVAIFGKLGLKGLDTTLATTIRALVMAAFLILVSLSFKKFDGFSIHSLSSRDWLLIILSAIAGALSWLFYFIALKSGPATGVIAIDKLSVVMAVLLASIFLAETITLKTGAGVLLMTVGALLVAKVL